MLQAGCCREVPMETTKLTMPTSPLGGLRAVRTRAGVLACQMRADLKRALDEEAAQGTTEYAILVGVLVVIAILAIVAFRDKVSELWEAISDGINSL